MRNRVSIALLFSLGLLFLLLPAAQADQVQMTLKGTPITNVYCNGDYCDPYQLSVQSLNSSGGLIGNPVLMLLNCDDFFDNIGIGSTWKANVISGTQADLSGTQMAKRNHWGVATAAFVYDEKAYIESHYSSADNPGYSLAIWSLFDPTYAALKTDDSNPILAAALHAVTYQDLTADKSTWRKGLTIYTPYTSIESGPNAGHTPQEFDRFDKVPDGGVTLMLFGGALVGLATLRRKFRA